MSLPKKTHDFAFDLTGAWHFSRRVSTGEVVSGVATLAVLTAVGAESSRWAYHEEGELVTAAGAALTATSEYIFALEGGILTVFFPDERVFQRAVLAVSDLVVSDLAVGDLVDFGSGSGSDSVAPVCTGESTHVCGDDTYVSRYSFGADGGAWQVQHSVAGPRKDYVSATVYRRCL